MVNAVLHSGSKPVIIDSTFRQQLLNVAVSESILSTIPWQDIRKSEFLDLPNEVLLSVFEHLSDAELYLLAYLSRRLHYLALPLYLARQGTNPFIGDKELVLNEHSRHILGALSSALFRPVLRKLVASFSFSRPKDVLTADFRRTRQLVTRLGALYETHVDIANVFGIGMRPDPWKMKVIKEVMTGKDWPMELGALLDAVLEKECKTLTVCMTGWLFYVEAKDLKAVLPGLTWLSTRFAWNLIRGRDQSWPWATRTALETFNLHSSLLLGKDMCRWSIETLNNSRISTLSLKNLEIGSEAWAVIMPCITLPFLSSLSVDMCSIKYPELVRFLQRHPHLQNLYIGRKISNPPIPDCEVHRSSDLLPNLTHLSGTPAYLAHFLEPQNAFPSLSRVTIITRVQVRRHFDFSAMNTALLIIAPNLFDSPFRKSRVQIAIELSFESSSDDWMLLHPAPDSSGVFLRHLSRIELHIWQYRLSGTIMARLPLFLALFPALREVQIWSPSREGPTEVEDRFLFVNAIFRKCPRLETLGINGVVRPLLEWVGPIPV